MSGLPYLCMLLMTVPFSWTADWLVASGKLSLTKTKKLMQSIGQIVPAIGLVGLAFIYPPCDRSLAVVWLCIAVGFNSASYSGYQVSINCPSFLFKITTLLLFQGNHMDIAPNYAGTMMGITNMIGNIAGFVTPYVTGAIIFENVRLSRSAFKKQCHER